MMRLGKSASALLLLAGFLVAGTSIAAACGNGKVVFEDKFQTLAESWVLSSDSDRPNAGGDGLTAAILPHHGVIARKVDTSFRDVDICAVATTSNVCC